MDLIGRICVLAFIFVVLKNGYYWPVPDVSPDDGIFSVRPSFSFPNSEGYTDEIDGESCSTAMLAHNHPAPDEIKLFAKLLFFTGADLYQYAPKQSPPICILRT